MLVLTASVMYARRVESVEVIGTLLYLPVFVAFMFGGIRGGAAAALAAAAAYAGLRTPAIDAVGIDRFTGLLFSRSLAYLAFGALGGLANAQLSASLQKLDLYDQVDDATGLYNARFFVQDTDLEMARSRRYHTVFSVALVDIPDEVLAPLGRRPRAAALREVARALRESVRAMDRPVHAHHAGVHRFAVVLPETGPEGATVFTDRLAARLREMLERRGAAIAELSSRRFAYPDDEDALGKLRQEFADIERIEHPEAPAAPSEPPAGPDRRT